MLLKSYENIYMCIYVSQTLFSHQDKENIYIDLFDEEKREKD